MNTFQDVCVNSVSVLSGIRPRGRETDRTGCGREKSGLVFIWSGGAAFWENGRKKVEAEAGDLIFIPRGCRYKMQYTEEENTFVLVNFQSTDTNGGEKLLWEHIEILARDDRAGRIAQSMANLELCATHQSPGAVFRKKELLYRILSLICDSRYALDKRQINSRIFQGVLLLEESFLENLPVAEFAAASNMSLSLFRRLFHEQYGVSPVQYRNRLRLQRAREFLAEGSCTVSEAAYASGFENVGYFCKSYKKAMGETPQETRKRNQ